MAQKASTSSDIDWELFDHHIEGDWQICNNCFTKTHNTIVRYDPQQLRTSLRGVLTGEIERYKTKTETDYSSVKVAVDSRRTACGGCGSVDRRMRLKRPVCTELAVEYAENLTETIGKTPGMSVEDNELVDEVRRLKVSGEHSYRNNRLYAMAFDATVDLDFGILYDNDEEEQ